MSNELKKNRLLLYKYYIGSTSNFGDLKKSLPSTRKQNEKGDIIDSQYLLVRFMKNLSKPKFDVWLAYYLKRFVLVHIYHSQYFINGLNNLSSQESVPINIRLIKKGWCSSENVFIVTEVYEYLDSKDYKCMEYATRLYTAFKEYGFSEIPDIKTLSNNIVTTDLSRDFKCYLANLYYLFTSSQNNIEKALNFKLKFCQLKIKSCICTKNVREKKKNIKCFLLENLI